MKIVLKGGPADGETWTLIDHYHILTRFAKSPNALYKDTGTDDTNGRRIFEHDPLKDGEPEPTEGVHHA